MQDDVLCRYKNVILIKFSSPAAVEVVKMTIFSIVGDENFIKMMILLLQYNLWYDDAIFMYDIISYIW